MKSRRDNQKDEMKKKQKELLRASVYPIRDSSSFRHLIEARMLSSGRKQKERDGNIVSVDVRFRHSNSLCFLFRFSMKTNSAIGAKSGGKKSTSDER